MEKISSHLGSKSLNDHDLGIVMVRVDNGDIYTLDVVIIIQLLSN